MLFRSEGVGCVIDDPHAAPPPAPTNGAAAPGLPLALMPYVEAFEGVYRVPNADAVRRQRAIDLSRTVLGYPERDRESLVAALLYRLAMRVARGGIV